MQEVISITPNGQILTFSSLAKARGILLEKYYNYIVIDPQHLMEKYSMQQLQTIMRKYGMDPVRFPKTHRELCVELWPQFIMCGRKNTAVIFGSKQDAVTVYYCLFTKGKSIAMDQTYLMLPPQAKVLVDLVAANIPSSGWPEHKLYKLFQDNKEVIKTRQDPWGIWTYYRKRLEHLGFVTTIM